jgi:alpha-L-fucosidase
MGVDHLTAVADEAQRPSIRKLGTLDLDMVETTPVVFHDRLYRFEYVRPGYLPNKTGESYFRFIDVETGKATPAFAKTFDLGCAYAEGETMWVFAVDNWDGEHVAVFRSRDLERWEQRPALRLSGWGLFNTSVCKAGDRYVMAIEVGKPPEVVGVPFTMRFAESKNLLDWKLLPEACVYTKERYSACPALRYLDGWFYMLYLEARPGPSYESHLVRSRELIHWETSPLNPTLKASPEDKQVANPKLTAEQRAKITGAVDLNNSDMDLCEFKGKTIIMYSWGNQQGKEFLGQAVYDGTLASFLKGYFP